MGGFRRTPSDLWMHEFRRWRGRYGLGDFLNMVDLDQYRHGKPRAIAYYAAVFEVNRKTVRRLLNARAAFFDDMESRTESPRKRGTVDGRRRDGDGTAGPNSFGQLELDRDTAGTHSGQLRDTLLENETETQPKEEKKHLRARRAPAASKTLIPDDWPAEADRERIDAWNGKRDLPYPDIDRRIEAFRLKCESNATLGANFTSRFIDYCNRRFLEPPEVVGESSIAGGVRLTESQRAAVRMITARMSDPDRELQVVPGKRRRGIK